MIKKFEIRQKFIYSKVNPLEAKFSLQIKQFFNLMFKRCHKGGVFTFDSMAMVHVTGLTKISFLITSQSYGIDECNVIENLFLKRSGGM